MKKVCSLWLLMVFLCTCGIMDPDIPVDYTVFSPEALPICMIKTVDVSGNCVQLEVSVNQNDRVSYNRLVICYSPQKILPDTTCFVQDITGLFDKGADCVQVTLEDLNYSSEYACRIYVENRIRSTYSSVENFHTKPNVSLTNWERIAELPIRDVIHSVAIQADNRVFLCTETLHGLFLCEYLSATISLQDPVDLPFAEFPDNWLGISDKLYTGLPNWRYDDRSWWCYDLSRGEWSRKKDVGYDISYVITCFTVDGKGYIVAESSSAKEGWLAFVYAYDPETDTWQKKSRFPGIKTQYATSAVIGGKAYLIGGYYYDSQMDEHLPVNSVWEYDVLNDRWDEKASFPGGSRGYLLAASSNEELFVGFGKERILSDYVYDWWCFSPVADTWRSCPTHQYWGAGMFMLPQFIFTLEDEIYIGSVFTDLWKYNREGVEE